MTKTIVLDEFYGFSDTDYRMMSRLRIVPRWCVIPTIQKQNVAEHTFNVMMLCDWLLSYHKDVNPTFHIDVMRYALGHDRHEALTGDVAAGSKPIPTWQDVAGKPPLEVIVKVADYLDAIAFLQEEIRLGNREYPVSIIADAKARMEWYWEVFPWHPVHGEKWNLDKLIQESSLLFYDPATVHPVFDVPF